MMEFDFHCEDILDIEDDENFIRQYEEYDKNMKEQQLKIDKEKLNSGVERTN